MIKVSDIETVEFQGVSLDDFLYDIQKEIEIKNYKVLKISNIDNIKERIGMKKGLKMEFRYYKIIEFCNLFSCAEMAMADFRAGAFLPQRYAIYQPLNDNSLYVSYLKPTAVARLFESERMMKTAKIMQEEMEDVLAALED